MSGDLLVHLSEYGFYCPAGDFYLDPWRPVRKAVVTHAHADHLAQGCQAYLLASPGEALARARLGASARIQAAAYGEPVSVGGVRVSFHPAGHILGSAQVRLEYRDQVWVLSGDYKVEPDPTCEPFEPVRCHTFITEATFGLPVYRWPLQEQVFEEINTWWRANQRAGKASLLFAYSLGKAQRVLAGLDASIGPVYTHGAVETFNRLYREAGVRLPPTEQAIYAGRVDWSQALVVAPPSARGSPWVRRFGAQSSGFASGWMRIRGMRRQRSIDRGFVLSDHVDWPALNQAIAATGAERVWATHGYVPILVRWLRSQGIEAHGVSTRYAAGEELADPVGEEE
jgi:putative mRNA 3-end processing factor